MKTHYLFPRIFIFIVGIFIMAIGVALSVKANLGVSPISCVPYIFSIHFPLTMGTTTIIFNILLILLQILVYGKAYNPVQLIQLPVVLAFGMFTDLSLYLVSGLHVTTYMGQMTLCLLSCAVIGFGVFLEVKADLTFLPGEGLAMAIADTFGVEFGKTKISVDSGMVLAGLASCLFLMHRLAGIREGTFIAAVLVGMMVRVYKTRLPFPEHWQQRPEPPGTGSAADAVVPRPDIDSAHHLVITISREFGSGGHELGRRIADQLNLPFFDKELIQLTAEQGGFTPDYIRKNEQKLGNTLLYRLYEQNYAYVNEQIPPHGRVISGPKQGGKGSEP